MAKLKIFIMLFICNAWISVSHAQMTTLNCQKTIDVFTSISLNGDSASFSTKCLPAALNNSFCFRGTYKAIPAILKRINHEAILGDRFIFVDINLNTIHEDISYNVVDLMSFETVSEQNLIRKCL